MADQTFKYINASVYPKIKAKSGIFLSFGYALNGILTAIRTERNMKLHMTAAVGVCLFAAFGHVDLLSQSILFFCMGLILFAEMLNTAFEALVDLHVESFHRFAKTAKDAAAGAVLILSAITAFIFANIIYLNQANFTKIFFNSLSFLNFGLPVFLLNFSILFLLKRNIFIWISFFLSMGLIAKIALDTQELFVCILLFIFVNLSALAKLK